MTDGGIINRGMGSLRTYPRVVPCPERPVTVELTPLRRQWLQVPLGTLQPTTISPDTISSALSQQGIVTSSFSIHGIRVYNNALPSGATYPPIIINHRPTGYITQFYGVANVEGVKGALLLPYASAGPYDPKSAAIIFDLTNVKVCLVDVSYVEIKQPVAQPQEDDDIAEIDYETLPIRTRKMLRAASHNK